ncbi:hypothetical protein STAQ_30210 [Allostella sp. ATCC 35155]|nr:hypothetical protein STAQ_30210 [Stella sp. ATCC 35155]
MPPGALPAMLGAMLGGGALLAWWGLQRLRDRERPDAQRRQGWWGINLGLALAGLSMILFLRS